MQNNYTREQTPHDTDLERAVLGALLLEGEAITEVNDILTPEMFFNEQYSAVFRAMQGIFDKGGRIDLLTVKNAVKGKVGVRDLAALTNTVASAINIQRHAHLLKEHYIARMLLEGAAKTQAAILSRDEDVDAILSKECDTLNTIQQAVIGTRQAKEMRDWAQDAMKRAEERTVRAKEGMPLGISTGLKQLDNTLGGWQKGELVVIAARPSMGKTAILLHFALQAARAKHPVAVFSLEMQGEQLTDRLYPAVANVDATAFKAGKLSDADFGELEKGCRELSTLPITIDDTPVQSMRHIRTRAMLLQRRGGLDIVFVDYLQLMEMRTERGGNREQAVAQTSKALKTLAKELDIPVVLLAQLNRDVEKREDKTPMLSDLRESGGIEQDADVVLMLHRPARYGQDVWVLPDGRAISTQGLGVLSVAKNRNGQAGNTILFSHNESLTRIDNYDIWAAVNNDNAAPF